MPCFKGLLGGFYFWKVTSWLRQTHKVNTWEGCTSERNFSSEGLCHSSRVNHGKRLNWTQPSTDLFGKERHDGEDDQGHENAVGPELQLVPVHPPGESSEVLISDKKHGFYYLDCIKCGTSCWGEMQNAESKRATRRQGDITRRHLAFNMSETTEAVWDLASISQLPTLLRRLGLILTSQICWINGAVNMTKPIWSPSPGDS